jgi:lysophospholipase L1-like esterase
VSLCLCGEKSAPPLLSSHTHEVFQSSSTSLPNSVPSVSPSDFPSSSPPRSFARYVALGDSSTEGIDDPLPAGSGYIGWSQRLAERLHATTSPNLHYANLAIRGLTTAQIRATQLDAALALRPDLATVFCGTNDVTAPRFDPARVAADIAHMQHALVSSGATVLTFTLPDLTPLMPLARLIAPRIAALNRALADASRATGTILVDFAAHPVATDARLWSEDRIHANSAGHARIAAALAQALNLPGTDATWSDPFPTPLNPTLATRLRAEIRWTTRHLLPWLYQSLTGRSSSLGRTAKRPQLAPVD